MLAETLDEVGSPLTGVNENEEVNRERDHLVETEIQFFEGDRVNVVVADAKVGAKGRGRRRRECVEEGSMGDAAWRGVVI